MRAKLSISLLIGGSLIVGLGVAPAWSQSLSGQPSEQQIESFCSSWGQMSGSQRKQYRAQYERYCDYEPVFGQPVEPQQQQQQQPSQQQQPDQEPQKPSKPDEPDKPEVPEPDLEPARPEPVIPEPVIPEPEPLRVDLVGRLELVGELARRPGERQRLRVTVANRGPGGGPHALAVNRLWARVFLSDRLPAVQGGRGVSLPAVQRGRPVRIAGVPSPGRSREQTAEVVLPATLEDGNYWWCVQVDSRQAIEETDEGNNTACARKVVALGGEPDSQLSGVFGSKVADLKERPREGKQTVSQASHPGLLRQSELDRLAAMLMKTGGSDYTVYTGQLGGDLSGAQKRGLLLMRERGDLIPLGGDYYADGRGNRVLFGELPDSSGDEATYAVTLLSGGGLNLVVDIDRDGVIDLGVSEGLKDRFGFLARPGLDQILECLHQAVNGGTGPAGKLTGCLPGVNGGSSGGGGSVGGGTGEHLDDVLSPQCGSEQKVRPGGVATTPLHNEKEELRDSEGYHRKASDMADARARQWESAAEGWAETGDEGKARSARFLAQKWRDAAASHEDAADQADGAIDAANRYERVAGDGSSTEAERARAREDYEDAKRQSEYDTIEAGKKESEARSLDDSFDADGDSGAPSQPGPGPGGTKPAGGSDPRCEDPSMWNRLATERCAGNMADCLKRMSDPIYAATGGQCETVRGPDDAERVKCKGNDSFAECLEGGDDVRSCAEKHAGGDDGGGVTPSLNDDMTPDDRGTLGYGLMDVHAFGGVLAAMCGRAGGIGPCGDPSPAMDELR